MIKHTGINKVVILGITINRYYSYPKHNELIPLT